MMTGHKKNSGAYAGDTKVRKNLPRIPTPASFGCSNAKLPLISHACRSPGQQEHRCKRDEPRPARAAHQPEANNSTGYATGGSDAANQTSNSSKSDGC